MGPDHPRSAVRDSIVPLALASLLGLAWCVRDHAALAALRLPDTDDGMRLQQIRDWLGGQAFADLVQHRLGVLPRLPMHWSRLADLLPAGLILLGTPLLGAHAATVLAVALVPILWFAAALLLVAAVARRLGVSGAVTAVLVALIQLRGAYAAAFLAAPIDLSGFLLPATRHRFLAGPYHRNAQGNRAMLDLFLRPPAQAEAIARHWGVDYVALCPDGLGELGDAGDDNGRLAGALRAGAPGWLAPVSRPGEAPMVYRLVGRGTRH